ncbi:MAG: CbtB domain-containing protein [Stellaceae bacterium]
MTHPSASAERGLPVAGPLARATPAVVAILLGSFLIFGAGFAPIGVLHNAAHDGRHSFAFPCH